MRIEITADDVEFIKKNFDHQSASGIEKVLAHLYTDKKVLVQKIEVPITENREFMWKMVAEDIIYDPNNFNGMMLRYGLSIYRPSENLFYNTRSALERIERLYQEIFKVPKNRINACDELVFFAFPSPHGGLEKPTVMDLSYYVFS